MTWFPATRQTKIIVAASVIFLLLSIMATLLLPFDHTIYRDLPTSIEHLSDRYATFHFPGPGRPKLFFITRSSQAFQYSFPGHLRSDYQPHHSAEPTYIQLRG